VSPRVRQRRDSDGETLVTKADSFFLLNIQIIFFTTSAGEVEDCASI
jgi:hypothetical protein